MRQLVNEATRQQCVNGTIQSSIIDYLYNKRPELFKLIKIEKLTTSDHLCIWARKVSKIPVEKPKIKRKRDVKYMDIKKYLEDLQDADISKHTESMDADSAAETINTVLLDLLDHYAPVKKIKERNIYCPAISEEPRNL